jgi:hypothetical protein
MNYPALQPFNITTFQLFNSFTAALQMTFPACRFDR